MAPTVFLRDIAKSSYHARLSSPEDTRKHRQAKDSKITSYAEAVQFLLSTYTTMDAINDANYTVYSLRQNRLSVQEYVNELAERAL